MISTKLKLTLFLQLWAKFQVSSKTPSQFETWLEVDVSQHKLATTKVGNSGIPNPPSLLGIMAYWVS